MAERMTEKAFIARPETLRARVRRIVSLCLVR